MRIVILLSGSGSNAQAVFDAVSSGALPIQISAVGSDTPDAYGLVRARDAGLETFVLDYADYPNRTAWTVALSDAVAGYDPDLVLSSGLMRIVGPEFIDRFAGRFINTHPALLPSFPGAHGVRDALAAGVKITGTTLHLVDAGVDTGRILDQRAVRIHPGEDEAALHERIKVEERAMVLDALTALYRAHQQNPDVVIGDLDLAPSTADID